MPRNEAGVYVKPAGTTAIPNTVIASAPYNTLQNDMADALTESLPRTGVASMLAPLPMGGNPITDLGATSSASGAATVGQVGHVASRNTVAELIADEVLSYTSGPGLQVVEEGQIITAQGFRYEVAASDATDVWLIETASGVKLDPLEDATGWVAFSQFGATPGSDDALAEENTYAMQRISAWAVRHNRLNLKIIDDFKVGFQKINPTPATNQRYYQIELMLEAEGNYSGDVVVDFAGGSLNLSSEIRYGSFDPLTGDRYDPPSLPFTDNAYVASAGYMVRFEKWNSVTILNPKMNGNIAGLVLGGFWSTTGRQVVGYGIRLRNNRQQYIVGGSVMDFPCDNVYVTATLQSAGGILEPISGPISKKTNLIDGLKAHGAGRNNLTVGGGYGGVVRNSSFNFAGRVVNVASAERVHSSPAAGLDVEAEGGGIVRDWVFEDCEFLDCDGLPFIAFSGDTAKLKFTRCKFRGTSDSSNFSVTPNRPDITFIECDLVGLVGNTYNIGAENYRRGEVHKDAVKFIRCRFFEEENTLGEMVAAAKVNIASRYGTYFKDCIFDQGVGRHAAGITVSSETSVGNFGYSTVEGCQFKYWLDTQSSSGALMLAGYAYLLRSTLYNLNPDDIGFDMIINSQSASAYKYEDLWIVDPTGRFRQGASGPRGLIKMVDGQNPQATSLGALANTYGSVAGVALLTNWRTGDANPDGTGIVRLGAATAVAGSGQLKRGDVLFLNLPSAGGAHAVRCTTSGLAGSTAVTKSFGNLEA